MLIMIVFVHVFEAVLQVYFAPILLSYSFLFSNSCSFGEAFDIWTYLFY